MRRSHLLAAAFAAAWSFNAAWAMLSPPSDAEINDLITSVTNAGADLSDAGEVAAAKREAVKAGMADVAWGEVTAAQLDRLATKGLLRPYPEMREAVLPRLRELRAEPTVEGARCADILMACWQPVRGGDKEAMEADQQARCDALVAALQHPKFGELLKAGKGGNIIAAIPQFPAAVVRERKLVETLEPFITTDLMPLSASALGGVFDLVTSEEFEADAALSKRIREKIGAAALAAADKDEPRLADDPKQAANLKKNLKDLATTCNSAFARGELLGNPAPAIAFTWSNHSESLKSFGDLKGKVVLVDFWATWCGPCVAAFPTMRALAEHYKGYPVVILGVTSDQGFHIARSLDADRKPERIDCDGDAAKEHGLMSTFIKDMNMTWTVAFSEQNVFNPDFGVRGIPHLAIIDPAGKVRHNGLRPSNPAHEAGLIDEILKEFKLPAPAQKLEGQK